jgi:hypothetical protein
LGGGGEHPINLLCQPFLPFDNEQKEKPTEDGLSVLFVSVFFCQHRADDIGSIGLVRVGEKNNKIVEKKDRTFSRFLEFNALYSSYDKKK